MGWGTSLVAAVLAIAMVAGCGGDDSTPTVDPAKIEPQLLDELAQDAGVDPSGVSLDCPSDEPAEEGRRFDCTLTAPDGSTASVRVTVTSVVVDGDEYNYDVDAVVPRSQFK